MGKSKGPKLRGWPKDVNEALAIATSDLGAIWHADEVRMFIRTKSAIKLFPGRDGEWLDGFTGLSKGEVELRN